MSHAHTKMFLPARCLARTLGESWEQQSLGQHQDSQRCFLASRIADAESWQFGPFTSKEAQTAYSCKTQILLASPRNIRRHQSKLRGHGQLLHLQAETTSNSPHEKDARNQAQKPLIFIKTGPSFSLTWMGAVLVVGSSCGNF